MLNCIRWSNFFCRINAIKHTSRCYYCQSTGSRGTDRENIHPSKIRNIGITAHIDAGKTTTTERMLYYSGYSQFMGEVHDGDTVMDYMEQERNRGITITSAAITFPWAGNRINLIDTPGHVDFTVEVERSLRVLDGAVAILDASAGVEAQTFTVWTQADKYHVPRIVYLNKMDKSTADVRACLEDMSRKLLVVPLMVQMPVHDNQGVFRGVVDLVSMTAYLWTPGKDRQGREFITEHLTVNKGGLMRDKAAKLRATLVEKVADLDDRVAEVVLEAESTEAVTPEILNQALRNITAAGTGIPTLCGSSYRNVAVQPLMDAVVAWLPSPEDRKYNFVEWYKGGLCALAFKVIHDKQKGRLVFLRLYSGSLVKDSKVYVPNRNCHDRISRLMVPYADNFKEVSEVSCGNIAVVSGTKEVFSGDTVVSTSMAFKAAQTALENSGDQKRTSGALLAGLDIPDPVFFCSIEPASPSQLKPLELALKNLQVEDPSLRVQTDEDTGQTVISGMGELHLDIIKDRLTNEYKVEAFLGTLQVAYREIISEVASTRHVLDRTLGGTRHHVIVDLIVEPLRNDSFQGVTIHHTKENKDNLAKLNRDHLKAVNKGVQSALVHGPLAGARLQDVGVKLQWLEVGPATSAMMITACASQCISTLLLKATPKLLEPIMTVEVTTDNSRLHMVLSDISARRGRVLEVYARHDTKTMRALVPLANLLGYSTALRTLTSGTALFSIEFHSYQTMDAIDQQRAIAKITGVLPS